MIKIQNNFYVTSDELYDRSNRYIFHNKKIDISVLKRDDFMSFVKRAKNKGLRFITEDNINNYQYPYFMDCGLDDVLISSGAKDITHNNLSNYIRILKLHWNDGDHDTRDIYYLFGYNGNEQVEGFEFVGEYDSLDDLFSSLII